MKFGLKPEIIKQVNCIFARYPQIEKAILYGSRAKGNYKAGSDIDLSLIGQNLTLSIVYAVELEIDDLLLPYTFDISIFNQISNLDLIEHINRVGLSFYTKFSKGVFSRGDQQ
jgi:predicted nucleotidyltransferase